MNVRVRKLYPQPTILSLKWAIGTLSVRRCIHLGANVDTILVILSHLLVLDEAFINLTQQVYMQMDMMQIVALLLPPSDAIPISQECPRPMNHRSSKDLIPQPWNSTDRHTTTMFHLNPKLNRHIRQMIL